MQIGNSASRATPEKLSRGRLDRDVAVGERIDNRLEVGDVALSQPGDLGPHRPFDDDARAGLRHLGQRGRPTRRDGDRDQLAEHTRPRPVVADDEPGRRDRGRELAGRGTGRPGGRQAGTPAQPGRRRSPPRSGPGVRRRSTRGRPNATAPAGRTPSVRAAEEQLPPATGLQTHGRLGAVDAVRRIRQVELACLVRQVLEPDHGIGGTGRLVDPTAGRPDRQGFRIGRARFREVAPATTVPEAGDHVGRRRQRGVGRIGTVAVARRSGS